MLETFDTNLVTAALVQSLLIGVSSCSSVVSGILINKFGLHVVVILSSVLVSSGFALSFIVADIRYLYVTVSVLAGAGISMIYVASITLVGKIFKGNQRSLCMSIYGTIVPVAGIFYPYLLEYLTNKYDLNGALLVISGIYCHGYIFSIILWFRRHELIIKTENSAEHVEHRHENVSLCMKLSNFIKQMVSVRFACLLGATALSVSSLNGFLTFAFDIAKWKGFQDSNANLLFIIHNLSACLLSLIQGTLMKCIDVDIYYYPFGFSLLAALGGIVLRFAGTFSTFAVGAALYGSVECVLSSAFIICTNLLCSEQVDVAVGTLQSTCGLLSICTGPIFGIIRDVSGLYNGVFLILTVTQAGAALLYIGDFISRKKKTNLKVDISVGRS